MEFDLNMYWIEVFWNIKNVVGFLASLSLAMSTLSLFVGQDLASGFLHKHAKVIFVISAITLIMCSFVPSKDVMLKMVVADEVATNFCKDQFK